MPKTKGWASWWQKCGKLQLDEIRRCLQPQGAGGWGINVACSPTKEKLRQWVLLMPNEDQILPYTHCHAQPSNKHLSWKMTWYGSIAGDEVWALSSNIQILSTKRHPFLPLRLLTCFCDTYMTLSRKGSAVSVCDWKLFSLAPLSLPCLTALI